MAASRSGGVQTMRGSGKTPMSDPLEALNLPQASRVAKERQQEILKDFEMRRKVQATVVPTDPMQVKNLLRELDEPITIFGEREMERRERLKRIVAERGVPLTSAHGASGQDIVVEVSKNQKELFYTEGTDALMLARKDVAAWSLMQAKIRIGSAKRKREAGEDMVNLNVLKTLSTIASESSEIAGARPVNCAAFSPDSRSLLTAGFGQRKRFFGV